LANEKHLIVGKEKTLIHSCRPKYSFWCQRTSSAI